MSKAAEASSMRRLAGIFRKPSAFSTTKSTGSATPTSTKPSSEPNISAVVTSGKSTSKSTSKSTISSAVTSSKPPSKLEKRAGYLQRSVKRFKKNCESDEFRNNNKTYAYTVGRLKARGKFSLIDDILQHQKKYQEISQEHFVIRLIKLYGSAGMVGHARKLFDEMPELKCDRTVLSFNALLSAFTYSKEFGEVKKLFKELPGKLGIEPDLISYNIVIKAHCEMKSFMSALSMVDTMQKKGIEPDIITFNMLLDGLFRNGRIADAEKIWGLMEEKSVVPDTWSYNSKIRGLVHEKRLSKAVELLKEMRSKGIEPDIGSYNVLISGYCINGDLEQVMKLYGELKKNGLSPDRVTYFRVIHLLCTKNELEMAAELCKELLDQWGKSNNDSRLLLNSVINELVNDSKIEEAKQLVELGKSKFHYKLILPKSE
ncbi:hypothetical protein COLO4_31673 [Corchorus olitorius]|uniref:Pentacotripeptide-repeat region of PRORP domain-containing protein n=1 Tax=Corchorus olitorius TaxID=93759 RepID=A0A1R3H418_9ROSI|nr:hypothetical protein COLO4_31673 [Corchorus olitorius]